MRRLRATMVAVAALGLACGCETLGHQRRDKSVADMVAGDYEPEAPTGAKGEARPSRRRGALSSEAGAIEDHLLGRSASADYR